MRITNGEAKAKMNFLASSNVGLIKNEVFKNLVDGDGPKMMMYHAAIPNYAQGIYKRKMHIEFHIAGYALEDDEALKRCLGEVVERYAALTSHYLINNQKLVFDSYQKLAKKHRVLPLKYLNLHTNEQYKELSKHLEFFSDQICSPEDKLWWIEVNAFKGEQIFIPAQLFFMGWSECEKKYAPSFTTGTATHINYQLATSNAIKEYIQIDAMTEYWYNGKKGKKIILDQKAKKIVDDSIGLLQNNYKVEFHLLESDYPGINSVACYLIAKNKRFPSITFGLQTDFSIYDAIERALAESLAIYQMNLYTVAYRNNYKEILAKKENFLDLDSNVLWYGALENKAKKIKIIEDKVQGIINIEDCFNNQYTYQEEFDLLTSHVKKNYPYATFMDITPPEVKGLYSVVRVYIPELFSMNLPSAPFQNHPKWNQQITDFNIHPLA